MERKLKQRKLKQLKPPPLPRGRGGIGRAEVRIPPTSLASAVQQDWPLCPVASRPQASPQPCSAPLLRAGLLPAQKRGPDPLRFHFRLGSSGIRGLDVTVSPGFFRSASWGQDNCDVVLSVHKRQQEIFLPE